MRLHYYCSSCQKENSFKTKAKNRFELRTERGNIISEYCKHCGTIVKRRINMVYAKSNKWILIIGTFFGIVFTTLTLIFSIAISLGFLLFVSPFVLTIPFIAWINTERKASAFNEVMLEDG